MRIEAYLDYFTEIKALEHELQRELLHEARHEAFVVLGLNVYSTVFWLLELITVFLITISSIVLLQKAYWLVPIVVGGVLFGMSFIHRYWYGRLLHKGLISVLKRRQK
ncbi:hypothetical protein [Aestuariibacter salexigens]|uniref:hypothetical protein n=1 Tax=Aestuariibacter salexigens TaxID=226010 RepID=UPI00041DB875|nr:hypothetical protein [Aestuariibacter salexigens]